MSCGTADLPRRRALGYKPVPMILAMQCTTRASPAMDREPSALRTCERHIRWLTTSCSVGGQMGNDRIRERLGIRGAAQVHGAYSLGVHPLYRRGDVSGDRVQAWVIVFGCEPVQ